MKIEITITPQIKITAKIDKKKSPAPKKPKAQSISQKTNIIINNK